MCVCGAVPGRTLNCRYVNLNGHREDLIAKILDAGSEFGSQFEVTTPQQYEIESQEQ